MGSRGFNLDINCELCGIEAESIVHVLCDYPVAKSVWKRLGISDTSQESYSAPLGVWLKINCESQDALTRPRIPWRIVFPQAVWLPWLHKNEFIFQSKRIDQGLYDQCIKRGAEFFAIVPENSNKPSKMQIQVKWIRPGQGWTKLNTDGAVFGDPKRAGRGGLLRNNEGD